MKDGEIKNKLSPAQVSVMLHRVTEPPYFGKFWDHFDPGTYRCAACETALFTSDEKFDSKTGWPSFKKPINERDLQFKSEAGPDDKVELRCRKCRCHLGYVISADVPYYRINSVCLLFEKREIPVTAAVAEISRTSPEKKTDQRPIVAEAPKSPVSAPTVGWTTGSLIAGSIISLLVGAGGTYLYLTRIPLPTVPDTASSTLMVATSTLDSESTGATEEAVQPAPRAPVQTTEREPETPIVNDTLPLNEATSTQ